VRLGVLGAGRWGPNLVRTFMTELGSEVVTVCDLSPERRELIAGHYPSIAVAADPEAVLADPSLDAVVVATPTQSHYELTRRALLAGKDVLVEKPLCRTVAEADELLDLARRRERVLFTGHVFLYNQAVAELKRRMLDAAMGDVYYVHARRTNLGPIRSDVHAGWDLAAHDVSVFLYLKETLPAEVSAVGQDYVRSGVPDVVFATLFFADGTLAHLHCSWLDPQKIRLLTVVGQHQMLVFDDMNLVEPLRIYHKGFDRVPPPGELIDSFGSFRVQLREGDVVIPSISTGEPLRRECRAFLAAVRERSKPLADGELGRDVVRVLAALDRSMAAGSRRVTV
jgi:predicted dehydrogenase